MRITIILGPYFPVPTVLGGAVEKIQLQLAEAYAAAGHQVTMVSRQYKSFPTEEIIAGVRHIRIPSFDRGRTFAMNLIRDFRYSSRAAKAIPPADITVTNGFSLPLLIPRAKAGRIYVHVARFPKGQFAIYRKVDRFQAESTIVADAIRAQAPALANKIVVVGNPINPRYFTQVAKEPIILFVGRVAREKGVEQLVKAFAALVKGGGCGSHWQLRIVGPHAFEQGGDGVEYLEELKRLAAPAGDRCAFIGPVFDEAALIGEYSRAAIFVYPTLATRGEALPLAPLEAMASGCAVVVPKLACFDDYIQNGMNGVQYDPDQLAGCLKHLMDDENYRETLASAGRAKADEFRLPIIAQKMLQDFESLLRT